MIHARTRALLVTVILVMALTTSSGAVFGAEDDAEITDLGTSHELDTADAISEFNQQGHTSADLTRLDMTVTAAENKDTVGLEDEPLPTDIRNDFLRFEYDEEATRTVRILVPNDYWTPYMREDVQSITTDHTAEFQPVRGGDYLAVTVTFDGPADVVVPVQWDSELSYRVAENIDNRLNKSFGVSVRGDSTGWTYVDDGNLTDGPGYAIGEATDDVTVQYDATPDEPERTWINAPEGETLSNEIYYYDRGDNGSAYIVSKTDDPPAVRYKTDSTMIDRIRGGVNDLMEVPDRIFDGLDIGFGGDILG